MYNGKCGAHNQKWMKSMQDAGHDKGQKPEATAKRIKEQIRSITEKVAVIFSSSLNSNSPKRASFWSFYEYKSPTL